MQGANTATCENACVERATLRQIDCLLKARSKDAVETCPY